jgi:hypothetical protein
MSQHGTFVALKHLTSGGIGLESMDTNRGDMD